MVTAQILFDSAPDQVPNRGFLVDGQVPELLVRGPVESHRGGDHIVAFGHSSFHTFIF
jgi:hypothetical protein